MKVRIEIHLYEPMTGLRAVERLSQWGSDDIQVPAESIVWWWTNGDGGCDCNRAMALDRAMGTFRCTQACDELKAADGSPRDCNHYPCNGRHVIIERLIVNGKVVLEEKEDDYRKSEEEEIIIFVDEKGKRKKVRMCDLSKEFGLE